MLLFLVYLNLS